MNKVIKTLGLYPIRVALHPEVNVEVTANVARSEEEAKLQAAGVDVTATDQDLEEEAGLAADELFEHTPAGLEEAADDQPAEDGAPSDAAQPSESDETENDPPA